MHDLNRITFFICPPCGAPIAWEPPDPPKGADQLSRDFQKDLNYLGKALAAMRERLRPEDLTFYITRDVSQPPPTLGEHVVVVVLADEWARVPTYAHQVLAAFKRYGTRPHLVTNPITDPSYRNLRLFVQFCQRWYKNLPGRLRVLLSTRSLNIDDLPLFLIPVGYFNQLELPLREIGDRSIDVLFDGSAVAKPYGRLSLRRYLGTVKSLSRASMLRSARRLAAQRPDLSIRIILNSGFAQSSDPTGLEYSRTLMDSKLCLCPRGSVDETSRLHEAWRFGAIPVGEALPPLPYLRDGPYLRVRSDWSDLDQVVDRALADPGRLCDLHERALCHWRGTCSEDAVGAFMAEKVNQQLAARAEGREWVGDA